MPQSLATWYAACTRAHSVRPELAKLTTGLVIAERFRLEAPVGVGALGIVWRGRELESRRRAALKFLRSVGREGAECERRFMREAHALVRVRHPNVISLRDALTLPNGTHMLVLDMLRGETLAERLARRGRLAFPELVQIFMPLCSALAAMHEVGIVHRDLKPSNIYLTEDPERVRVLDFGAAMSPATSIEDPLRAFPGEVVGTPFYMAPEQALADPTLDHRADIFSLGVIAYEALTGERPTSGDSLGQVLKRILSGPPPKLPFLPDLPPEFADLVHRMLASEAEDRPFSAGEVWRVLARHCSRGDVPALVR